MVLGMTNKVIKLIIFILSFVIFLLGLLMLIIGLIGWAKADNKIETLIVEHTKLEIEQLKLVKDKLTELLRKDVATWVMIGLGAFLLALGFAGCAGAIYESSLLLYLFSAVVGLMILGCIGLIVLIAIKQESVWKALKDGMEQVEKEIGKKNQRIFSSEYEAANECCGIDMSYVVSTEVKCGMTDPQQSCFDVIKELVSGYDTAVYVVLGLVIVIKIVTMLFTCTLISAIG